MPLVALPALLACAPGCGGDDDGGGGSSSADASPGSSDAAPGGDAGGLFVLESSAFPDGGEIPPRHACADSDGDDVSPPLSWSGGPAAAGYAVVLTDLSIEGGFVHWVLWDVPGDLMSLPEDVDKVEEPEEAPGAKQTLAFDGETRGYRGPCPPDQHTYELALYAVDENPLSGVSLDSTRDEVAAVLADRALAAARLTGTFAPP
ncbi:MAG TPA: YbhB/YbcL family Raf kinase inhibitor-like protein [Kofleriaceae bacterium]|nr:YbhB/YbcL family Raf kinase inhibitor-like protein [Kofleriaceae bacterium]